MHFLFLQVSTRDWVRAETTYDLCEVLFKVDKVSILCTLMLLCK